MDEKTAWEIFEHSGRVEDYLQYSKIRLENSAVKQMAEGTKQLADYN